MTLRRFAAALLALAALLVGPLPARGQAEAEALARLYYSLQGAPADWFEGYGALRSGSFAPYASYRDPARRDSAFVVRTSGEESLMEWATAAVPRQWSGDSASFLWVCGFGNNLGNERFELDAGNGMQLTFSTPDAQAWSVSGPRGMRLSFVAASRNSNGANIGFMVLRLPRAQIQAGAPVTVRVRSTQGRTEVWYRVYAYRDAARFFRAEHADGIFFRLDLRYFGDATLTLCGGKQEAGSAVRLLSRGASIGDGKLRANGAIATVSIVIPRHLQPPGNEVTLVRVARKTVDTLRWGPINRARLRAFFQEELGCERYVFPPGDLPGFAWKRPAMVDNEMGTFPLTVDYYDAKMRPVTRAGAPGRYAAVVKGVLPSGFTIRRYVTLFCAPVSFDDYSENVPMKFRPLEAYGISEARWRLYEKSEERFAFGSMKMLPERDPDAAVFLAGLSELDTAALPGDTPRLRDRQWWASFKLARDGRAPLPFAPREGGRPDVRRLEERPSSVAPYSQADLDRIRAVCREWASSSGVPHVALIAQGGRIVFHEAFNGGAPNDSPVRVDSPLWMASITKLLTGTLMMEFVDRGLVDLDAHVGTYLPELTSGAARTLTVRQLFTHVTGLDDLGDEWASDWNPALENYVAQALPSTPTGERFSYHRVGYAIAGRVMERLTGRVVPALFREHLFAPLGMTSAYADNTYGGLYCTAADLARLGQMLLNRGAYAGSTFFSDSTFRLMLPAAIAGLDRRWGIGTSPMDEPGLSGEAFGHAAASGSVFRVDPANELVVISARNHVAGNQEAYERRLIEAATAPFRHE